MNQKEALFYSDLVYHIRKLSGIIKDEDSVREKRIKEREKGIEQIGEDGEPIYLLSNFTLELFKFTLNVSRKGGNKILNGPSDLYKHQDLVKKEIKEFYLKVAEDYSDTPGARYISDGPSSGEDFRDNVLEPKYLACLSDNRKLIIDLDGGYGYSTGFLEETFGGLIRKGYHCNDLLEHMVFIYNEEPDIIEEIITYMKEEEERLKRDEKKPKVYIKNNDSQQTPQE